ncbi:DUF2283 domain-containing protein [Candidatus Wolfebacteria bacterium]|nr:DUF2283 domain-containing protein [Candidatus Wolfebacteria bacterium]
MKYEKPKKVVHYDPQSDVFYIGVKRGNEEEHFELAPGINIELGRKGQVIGIEILNASKVFKPAVRALGRKILEPVSA